MRYSYLMDKGKVDRVIEASSEEKEKMGWQKPPRATNIRTRTLSLMWICTARHSSPLSITVITKAHSEWKTLR